MNVEIIKLDETGINRMRGLIGDSRIHVTRHDESGDIDSIYITNFNNKSKSTRPVVICSKGEYTVLDVNNNVFVIGAKDILDMLFSNKHSSINIDLVDDKDTEKYRQCPTCGDTKHESKFRDGKEELEICDKCVSASKNITKLGNERKEVRKCPKCNIDVSVKGFRGKHSNLDVCPKCNDVYDHIDNKWIDIFDAISKFVNCNENLQSTEKCNKDDKNTDNGTSLKTEQSQVCLECGSSNISERKIADCTAIVCTSCGKAHEVSKTGELVTIDDFSQYCIDKYNNLKLNKYKEHKGSCACGNDKFYKVGKNYVCTSCQSVFVPFTGGIYAISDIDVSDLVIDGPNVPIVDFKYTDSDRDKAKEIIEKLNGIQDDNFKDFDSQLLIRVLAYTINQLYNVGGTL